MPHLLKIVAELEQHVLDVAGPVLETVVEKNRHPQRFVLRAIAG